MQLKIEVKIVVVCYFQDLTELQKERQCLEKQHQQEVNKLNQEIQQARTLHNALQAQADKVHTYTRSQNPTHEQGKRALKCSYIFAKIKPLYQITINTGNWGTKWYSEHIVCILVHMSTMFFQLFPVSFSCFLCLYPLISLPHSFSRDLY